jgi:hypothetical protein
MKWKIGEILLIVGVKIIYTDNACPLNLIQLNSLLEISINLELNYMGISMIWTQVFLCCHWGAVLKGFYRF